MVVIGCDIGTQSTKAVAMDDTARTLATATEQYGVSFPEANWAEQDANDWREATLNVITSICQQLGRRRDEVTHIAIDAQVDGVVGAAADLTPLTPAIIWLDRRAVTERTQLEAAVGSDRIFELTGLNPDSSHGAPKIMWLRSHHQKQVRWWLPPAAAVVGWLTGEVVQDHANASSTMLYDVRARTWSPQLLAAADIDPASLPEIRESVDVSGTVLREVAVSTGLPKGCVVLVGTGDDHASAVCAGATRPGIVADITGTAEPIGVSTREPVFDGRRLLESHAHAAPGSWFLQNPGIVSGGAVLWVSRMLDVSQTDVFELAAKARPGSDGLRFLPALSGSMAPRWNEYARGAFTGASMNHGRPELARAVLEGCTFALNDNISRIQELVGPVDEVRATGGGARSDLWLQMKADVTGQVVRRVMGAQAAVGAACLAAVAAGWSPDVTQAADSLADLDTRTFEPCAKNDAVYAEAYAHYRATFDALEPTFASHRSTHK